MMIICFDIALYPRGSCVGKPTAGLAFWRTQLPHHERSLGFWRRKNADFSPAWPVGSRKTVEKHLACPFSGDGQPTSISLEVFTTSITSYWASRKMVSKLKKMFKLKLTFLLQGLRVAEVAGLAHTLCSLYESCAKELSADVYLRNVMADLKDLSDRILDALRNNHLISSLEKFDAHRLRCVSALINLKKGYDKLSDEPIQSHWTVLRPVFENYLSAIQVGNYQSKTALINALLLRLSEKDLASHLEALGTMQTAVDRLSEAEKDFETMQVEYQHQLLEDKTESATDLKEAIFELINQKLVVHLEAKCNEDAATYDVFARFVDAQIRTDNAKLRRRKGKKETSPEIPSTE